MVNRKLDALFRPETIAVIGASSRSRSVGQIVFQNLTGGGFRGPVFPVNPNHESIDGKPCYPDLAAVPEDITLAVICTPARVVPDIVRECGEKGVEGAIIITAGFGETDEAGQELKQSLKNVLKQYPQLTAIGPNCLGIMAPHLGLNASFASDDALAGNLAFISQSGALCTSVLDWSLQQNVGFSYFVSIGNMIDVGFSDILDYLSSDEKTDAVILYLESLANADRFLQAARILSGQKPIIAMKSGRYAESSEAAASHTGAMAGDDAVYDAAFERVGILRLKEIEDLFQTAELLTQQRSPAGPRLGIVTNAGGPGVIAADALVESHGELAELSSETLEEFNEQFPKAWSEANPVDILGDATPQRFRTGVEILLADQNVDAILMILTPQAMTAPSEVAEEIIPIYQDATKPILAVWMGGRKIRDAQSLMNEVGIPTYSTPEKAVQAFGNLVSYADRQKALGLWQVDPPADLSQDRTVRRSEFDSSWHTRKGALSEHDSKAVLQTYDIPIAKTQIARDEAEAVRISTEIGFPVAMKLNASKISHKTDFGGVQLDLKSEDEVTSAFQEIMAQIRQEQPEIEFEGVTVQQMLPISDGCELILGAKSHAAFGNVLLIGGGGIMAELYADKSLELPPLNEELALRALKSLRIWPLLNGYRGRPRIDVDRLVEVIIKVSYLVADCPEIQNLDINPLLATPETVIALDAYVELSESHAERESE